MPEDDARGVCLPKIIQKRCSNKYSFSRVLGRVIHSSQKLETIRMPISWVNRYVCPPHTEHHAATRSGQAPNPRRSVRRWTQKATWCVTPFLGCVHDRRIHRQSVGSWGPRAGEGVGVTSWGQGFQLGDVTLLMHYRKYIFGQHSCSWHRARKALESPKCSERPGVFCYS